MRVEKKYQMTSLRHECLRNFKITDKFDLVTDLGIINPPPEKNGEERGEMKQQTKKTENNSKSRNGTQNN